MGSIDDLQGCAKHHLDHYMSPLSTRSFLTYDIQGDQKSFGPLDALAPALLAAPVRSDIVKKMFAGDPAGPHMTLRKTIEHLLYIVASKTNPFDDNHFPYPTRKSRRFSEQWSLVLECFDLVKPGRTPYIKATTLSKMLHRKLPYLIPIIDSKVADFYGLKNADNPLAFFEVFGNDGGVPFDTFLIRLTSGRLTPDRRPLSMLRARDIIIWEHVVTKCQHSQSRPSVCGYSKQCGFCYPETGQQG